MLKALVIGMGIALGSIHAHGGSEHDARLAIFDYSPYYQLAIPTENLAGARIFSGAGPAIKFSDSLKLAGWVTAGEEDGLPKDFDLARYPRYVLGLEATDALPAELKRVFSLGAFGLSQDAVIAEEPYGNGILYSACDYPSCVFFATHQTQNEHILVLKAEGFDVGDIRSFLETGHVE